MGRIRLQQPLQLERGRLAVERRRQSQRELERRLRPQHVAGVGDRRQAIGTGDRQRGTPGAVQHRLGPVGFHRLRAPGERILANDDVAEDIRRGSDLRDALGGNRRVERRRQDAPGGGVLDAVEQATRDAERRRHHAAGVARMHALGQHLDGQRAGGHAAQRRRDPQPLVVAGARVEPDDEIDAAQPRLQRVDVRRQVVAAALLAGLDQAHAARVRLAGGLQRRDRRQRREHRVAVVGAAATVQAAVFHHRHPRSEAVAPAVHLGLLVEVAVEQHRRVALGSGTRGHFEEQHRRAALEPDRLDHEPFDRLPPGPRLGLAHHRVDVAVARPVGVEVRALRRHADVLGDLRDDVVVPGAVDQGVRNGHGGPERLMWVNDRCEWPTRAADANREGGGGDVRPAARECRSARAVRPAATH